MRTLQGRQPQSLFIVRAVLLRSFRLDVLPGLPNGRAEQPALLVVLEN